MRRIRIFATVVAFLAPFTLPSGYAADAPSPVKPAGGVLVGVYYEGARIGATVLEEVKVSQGVLTAAESGKKLSFGQLDGVLLRGIDNGGNEVKLRVHGVAADAVDPELTYYGMEYWRSSTSEWQPLCVPDARGERKALLFEGVWDVRGVHQESKDLFTVGCTSSAIGKCAGWGYKPWKSVAGRALAPFHQACTRMVRADYLGDGSTNTKEGTVIFYNDVLGLNRTSPESGLDLEAAWGVDGAIWIAKPRVPELAKGLVCAEGRGCVSEKPREGAFSREVLLINYSKRK